MNSAATAFDGLAETYDHVWTLAPAGRAQREAVWATLGPLLTPGMRAIDLGCGTGEDALRLLRAGVEVDAIDASPQMVARSCAKGIRAQVRLIEESGSLNTAYNLALSNFGAMNCVRDLNVAGQALRRLVRPGGIAVLCLLNRFCLWETLYLALHGEWRKSVRRLGGTNEAAIGVRVRYYSANEVRAALGDDFRLETDCGIGILLPPSFVPAFSHRWMVVAERLDRRLAATSFGRSIADHHLLVFRRAA